MNAFRRELRFCVLFVGAALLSACTSPGYNDNPSQRITDARLGCGVGTDFFIAYFSVHVQPLDEHQDARITRELFRAYCNELPTTGRVFFTADLVGSELRRVPIAIRIAEQEFAGGDESRAENFKDRRTISEVLAQPYPNGVIESRFEVDKNGYYAIDLIRGRVNDAAEAERLRILLRVGLESSANRAMTKIGTVLGIAAILALMGFFAFRYLRNRMVL